MSKSGVCPNCKSEDLEYESIDFGTSGEVVFYPVTCRKCGFSGKEWYDLTFTGFTDENGDDIDV